MIEYWKKCFPFTIGIILSVFFVLFAIEFVRMLDLDDLEDTLSTLPYLWVGIGCGLFGVPLVMFGIDRLTGEES
ncbi:hypothetical protein HNR48_002201 [Pseudoteredinibacter isoporae]|uniref:Uncharacterized protein n=1 Tax=Pseudoteredinibacter isoporae TaxID=570281 RepID=A0A7X0JV78_9GAMM|nr:hypothetical protein [Pseudoteredinibacter isoporae]